MDHKESQVQKNTFCVSLFLGDVNRKLTNLQGRKPKHLPGKGVAWKEDSGAFWGGEVPASCSGCRRLQLTKPTELNAYARHILLFIKESLIIKIFCSVSVL